MTPLRRGTAVLLVLLAALVGWPGTAAADTPRGATAARVLIVGVPGLTWDDVAPRTTPHLWALAEDSPIGAISVRASRSTTCLLDGWGSLGAGNRVQVPGPDQGIPPIPLAPGQQPSATGLPAPGSNAAPAPQYDTSLTYCGLQERVATIALSTPAADVQRAAADPGTTRFGAEPGALGAAVGCATVIGRAAALAVAAPRVQLTRSAALPTGQPELRDLLSRCRLSLVSLDQLTDAGQPGAGTTVAGTDPTLRPAALTQIDDAVGRLRTAVAALPGQTLLLLQGISEVNDGRPQLHVGIASGPGFTGPGWLTSASTGRAPYAELIDVAPTALQALGITAPASMNGQALQVAGQRPSLPDAVTQLERANTGATVHYRHTGLFFWILVMAVGGLVVLGALALGGWRRASPPPAPPAWTRRAVRTASLLLAALPVATYLADLAPWERAAGAPGPALLGALIVADLAVAAFAGLGPWRRHRLGPPLALLGVTWATILGDVLTGSHLELNGLLGYDAIVAGRFVGYGNLTLGLHVVCALLITAAAATALGRRARPARERWVAGGAALLIGLATVGIIGTPSLGRDFGGVLAALPGFLLLAMLVAHVRVTVIRMGAILGAAVVAVGTVAFLDWLQPPTQRSHLGRFVEQILTGEAWTVISRKAQANLGILRGSPLAWMLPVAIVAAVWLLRPGGALRSRAGAGPGGLSERDTAVLRAGLLASLLSVTLGALVNDSGVAVAATAAALLVPLLVWLAAGTRAEGSGAGETEGGSPRSGPADAPDRVTVVSRGSTVWNT
ncbi:MAG: rane protein of unknown function [Blastococcus sp.]|nr:rane protein of unknown function [Blastococcus sp.]